MSYLKGSPLRQCFTTKGEAKKQFATLAEAEQFAKARHGDSYEGYACSDGHFHVGKRNLRSAFCTAPGCNAIVPRHTWLCEEHQKAVPT